MPTWPISKLTCDNVSRHSGKFARLNLTPRQISCAITQFPGREIHLHQADQFLFTESNNFFIKLKTSERIENSKDINLQKMQSILLQEIHFTKLK